MHVQERRQLGRRIGGKIPLQATQFGSNLVARVTQARDLCLNLCLGDKVVINVNATGRNQHRAPDGNATRHRQTKDLETHRVMLAAPPEATHGVVTVRGRRW